MTEPVLITNDNFNLNHNQNSQEQVNYHNNYQSNQRNNSSRRNRNNNYSRNNHYDQSYEQNYYQNSNPNYYYTNQNYQSYDNYRNYYVPHQTDQAYPLEQNNFYERNYQQNNNQNYYDNRQQNQRFKPAKNDHGKNKKPNESNAEATSNVENKNKVEKQNKPQNSKQNFRKNDKSRQADRVENASTTNTENPKQEKTEKPKIEKPKKSQQPKPTNLSRSEILIDQLKKNKCECMVCYSIIRNDKQIWSCNCCYHIFHLGCIKKWARSPAAKVVENSEKWRCPGCQSTFNNVPNKYNCFCGKKINPEPENRPFYQLKLIPHSCNEVCGKPLASKDQQEGLECKHKCLEICHPGPCSTCEAVVNRSCNCGKSKFQVKCSSSKVPECDKKCDRLLNCKIHVCERICHAGDCEPCDHDVEIKCNSHQEIKPVKCGSDELKKCVNFKFNCEKPCDNILNCKNHKCTDKCHEGECKPCLLMPSKLINCPCGQTQVKELLIKQKIIRTTCADPVPTCDKKCSKLLPCNSSLNNEVHLCESNCHTGDCPPCEKLIEVKCRCGKETDLVKCCEKDKLKLCDRRCQKKKSCGKHHCSEICCEDKDHICMQICNKVLSCGLHKCEDLCHKGPCKRCLVASFEERICECGKTIQYPPIRCGTKPLDCSHPCSRTHACNHPISHTCHWEENCPPCSYLTSKICMGNHEVRQNIPCYLKDVSCGKPCGKQLTTCSHKCIRTCHKGECIDAENAKCTQLCQKPRPHCDHPCNSACHGDTECPDIVCQELMLAKCKCGLKSKQVKCMQKMYGESSVVFENMASQLKEMLSCRSIDVSSFNKEDVLKKRHELECDEECFLAERNRNIAQALQIDAQNRPKPIYNDFLKNFAREDPNFVFNIEQKFGALVQECKLFKTKKTAYLPVMKSNERRFVHELATYYAIETVSEDPEPNRSITMYGSKEKCYIPSVLLSQSIDLKVKQTSMPKIAIKQLNQKVNPMQSNMKTLVAESDPISTSSAFSALIDEQYDDDQEDQNNLVFGNQDAKKEVKDEKVIDYFDFN